MAVTVTIDEHDGAFVAGSKKIVTGTIAFDSAYPTGGEAITAADLGLEQQLDHLQVAPSAGFVFEWDSTNDKILAYWVDTTVDGAAMAQVVNNTDIDAAVAHFLAIGE